MAFIIHRPEYRDCQDPEVRDLIDYFESGKFEGVTDLAEFYALCNRNEIDTITAEIDAIRSDFRYAAKNYFWIVDKDGKDKLFTLWESQELICESLADMKRKGKPQKVLVIKARQLGCSLLLEAMALWAIAFFPNRSGLVVSWEQEHAAYLFRYMHSIYSKLPVWLKPDVRSFEIKKGIIFDTPFGEDSKKHPGINSTMNVQWANKLTGVGMGMRLGFCHMSEFESYMDPKRVIEEELKYALVNSPETIAVLESTAKGAGGYGNDLWDRMVDLAERAEWQPRFLPFFFEKSYFLSPPRGWIPTVKTLDIKDTVENEWVKCDNPLCSRFHDRFFGHIDRDGLECLVCEKGTLHVYELSNGQMYYMEDAHNNATDKRKIEQELAISAKSAFIVSGNSVFPDECLDFVNAKSFPAPMVGFFDNENNFHGINKEGLCCVEGCKSSHEDDQKIIQVWEPPKRDAEYYAAIDPSNGVGQDNSVIWVNRVNRKGGFDVHCCTLRSNTIDAVDLAIQGAKIATWYNEAQIACEITGPRTTADYLRLQLQYPNLYRKLNIDSSKLQSNVCGFQTDHVNKPKIIINGIRFLRTKRWFVRDPKFASEMRTFRREDDRVQNLNNVGASKKFKDDTVMAGLICLYCSHETDWDDSLGFIPIKKSSVESAPWVMSCDMCNQTWGAEIPNEEDCCPKCGSIRIVGHKNFDPPAPGGVKYVERIMNRDADPDNWEDDEDRGFQWDHF
jgi:hypothetical protein